MNEHLWKYPCCFWNFFWTFFGYCMDIYPWIFWQISTLYFGYFMDIWWIYIHGYSGKYPCSILDISWIYNGYISMDILVNNYAQFWIFVGYLVDIYPWIFREISTDIFWIYIQISMKYSRISNNISMDILDILQNIHGYLDIFFGYLDIYRIYIQQISGYFLDIKFHVLYPYIQKISGYFLDIYPIYIQISKKYLDIWIYIQISMDIISDIWIRQRYSCQNYLIFRLSVSCRWSWDFLNHS